MNETVMLLTARKSERSFKDAPVPDNMLDAVIEAGYRAPTTKNIQDVSVIVVRDHARKAKLAEYAGNQVWVAQAPIFLVLVADLRKAAEASREANRVCMLQDCVEGLIVSGQDCGIAFCAMQTAANSLGLGVVPIGGIRNNPPEVVDLLELPPLTFPMLGMCIGYVNKPSRARPRLPMDTFRHDERYNPASLPRAVKQYDETLRAFWRAVGRPDGKSWSETLGQTYDHNSRPKIRPTLTMQGLSFMD